MSCRSLKFYSPNEKEILELICQKSAEQQLGFFLGCKELERLILQDPHKREQIILNNGIVCLATALKYFNPKDFAIQSTACFIFQKLISHENPSEIDIQLQIVESGSLPNILESMKLGGENVELAANACKLIYLLCFDSPRMPHEENQIELVKLGAFESIDKVLRNCQDDRAIGEAMHACWGLCYQNFGSTEFLVKSPVLQSLMNALCKYEKSAPVLENISRLIYDIVSVNKKTRRNLLMKNVVEKLVSSIPYHASDTECLEIALMAVELIVRNNETAKEVLCSCDGHSVLKKAVKNCHSNNGSKSAFAYFMGLITFSSVVLTSSQDVHEDRVAKLVEAEVQYLAATGLKECTYSIHVLEQSIRLIGLLSHTAAGRFACNHVGAIRHIKCICNTTHHDGLSNLSERTIRKLEERS